MKMYLQIYIDNLENASAIYLYKHTKANDSHEKRVSLAAALDHDEEKDGKLNTLF